MEKPYREQILGAVLGIYELEHNETWIAKNAQGLYLPKPPMWRSPDGLLTIRDTSFAFNVPKDGSDSRTKPPSVLNQARLILHQEGVEITVSRVGEDIYQNTFSRDIVLPWV